MTAFTPTSSDERLDRIEQKLDTLAETVGVLAGRVNTIFGEVERSNDKLDTYQKATQRGVQLAFTLIASATITVIISTVLS